MNRNHNGSKLSKKIDKELLSWVYIKISPAQCKIVWANISSKYDFSQASISKNMRRMRDSTTKFRLAYFLER